MQKSIRCQLLDFLHFQELIITLFFIQLPQFKNCQQYFIYQTQMKNKKLPNRGGSLQFEGGAKDPIKGKKRSQKNELSNPPKAYSFEQVDKLYKQKIKTLDNNLGEIYEFLKPQAQSIYFDRKVEFNNLVNEERTAKHEKLMFQKMNKKEKIAEKESQYEKNTAQIRNLMNVYDIKHPLRGAGFEEIGTLSQPFHHKIQQIVAGPNSYMGYKKDIRHTLEQSAKRSESYLREEQLKFQNQRTVMKYRLYGRDGITDREYNKLVEWKIIKLKPGDEGRRAVRVKKRIKKKKEGKDGHTIWYSSEDSRSVESAYTTKMKLNYQDNEDGDPAEVNNGFEIQPLDRYIYGPKAAQESKAKRNQKTGFYKINNSSRNNMQGNQSVRQRTPLKIPELNLSNQEGAGHGPFTQTNKDIKINLETQQAIQEHQQVNTQGGAKTHFAYNSKGSLGSDMDNQRIFGGFRGGHTGMASNLPQGRQRIIMPHLVNKYGFERNGSINGGYGIDEVSDVGYISPEVNNQHSRKLGFSFGGESVAQLQDPENATQLTQSSKASMPVVSQQHLTQRVEHRKHSKVDFIIDKRTGAKFKYKEHKDNDDIYHHADEHFNSTMMINNRGDQTIGGSQVSHYGASTLNIEQNNLSARGGSMLVGSVRRQKIKHPQNMSQLTDYTVKVKVDAREAGSPFRFKLKKDIKLKANLEKKALGEGRHNKTFTKATPKLGDNDIKQLISKYPLEEIPKIKASEQEKIDFDEESRKKRNILAQMSETELFKSVYGSEAGKTTISKVSKQEAQFEQNRQRKRELAFLGKNIDKMERQSKAHQNEFLTKQVIQDFRDTEIGRITEHVKELEFAAAESLHNQYKLKMLDEEDKQKVMIEVTKEHQNGKLDPKNFAAKRKVKRK